VPGHKSKGSGGPDEKHAANPEEECPDAEVVEEYLATGDLQTDLFEIGTNRFVVSYEILNLQKGRALPSLLLGRGDLAHPVGGVPPHVVELVGLPGTTVDQYA
jgi:hypothetical protein